MPDLAAIGGTLGDEWSELGELLEMVTGRPAWHAQAACRNAPLEVTWFAERGEDQSAARAICKRCPVIDDCRAWALAQRADLQGMWAGLSDSDRRAIRSGRAA